MTNVRPPLKSKAEEQILLCILGKYKLFPVNIYTFVCLLPTLLACHVAPFFWKHKFHNSFTIFRYIGNYTIIVYNIIYYTDHGLGRVGLKISQEISYFSYAHISWSKIQTQVSIKKFIIFSLADIMVYLVTSKQPVKRHHKNLLSLTRFLHI